MIGIYGERMQKNFPTETEARTFINVLLEWAGQGDSSPTRATRNKFPRDEDLREAEFDV